MRNGDLRPNGARGPKTTRHASLCSRTGTRVENVERGVLYTRAPSARLQFHRTSIFHF